MLTPPELYTSAHKLRRANEHLDAIERFVAKFMASEPYTLERLVDRDRGLQALRIVPRLEVPRELSIVVAECAHQLRSTLDHIVCQLAQLEGIKCRNPLGFPILAERLNRVPNSISRLSEPVRDVILELQPYRRSPDAPREDPLFVIHELDRVNKHQVVVVAAATLAVNVREHPGMTMSASSDPPHTLVTWPADLAVEPRLIFEVAFPFDGAVAPGAPVVPTLRAARDAVVGEIWPTLVRLFPGHPDDGQSE